MTSNEILRMREDAEAAHTAICRQFLAEWPMSVARAVKPIVTIWAKAEYLGARPHPRPGTSETTTTLDDVIALLGE